MSSVVGRLAAHERRWLASLVLWVGRRRYGVRPGDRMIGYARAQASTLYGLGFVCLVETVGLHFMLAGAPTVRLVVFVLDLYTLLMVLGFQAAAVTRPHVLAPDGLRVRRSAQFEVWIPLERIASVRYDLRFPKLDKAGARAAAREGVLELPIASQTDITVELCEPVTVVRLLGEPEQVRTVRFHADEARAAVALIKKAVEEAAAGTATGTVADGEARAVQPSGRHPRTGDERGVRRERSGPGRGPVRPR